MRGRIALLGLYHESNTFLKTKTSLKDSRKAICFMEKTSARNIAKPSMRSEECWKFWMHQLSNQCHWFLLRLRQAARSLMTRCNFSLIKYRLNFAIKDHLME